MYGLKRRFLINHEMSKTLKDSTNKYIATHLKPNAKYMGYSGDNPIIIHLLLPIVSLVSFIIGYNFRIMVDN